MGENVYLGKGFRGGGSDPPEWEELDPYTEPVLPSSSSPIRSATAAATTRSTTAAGRKKKTEGTAVKNARLKAAEIERVNRIMGKKLQEIKREPPSAFHAPNSYKSMRGGRNPGMQRTTMMQGRTASKPQQEWPPVPDETELVNRGARQREIEQENVRIAAKLDDRYKRRKDSFVTANQLGKGVDLRGAWQERTAIYRGSPSKRGARASAASTKRPPAAADTGVPKSLGVALCSGCGKKSYYGADGKRLRPCEHCASVWYCSDTCAKVDWQHHKKMCKYVSGGQGAGTWSATTPAEDCWISNAAMRRGRELLAEKTKRYPGGDATRHIRHEMQAISLADAEREAQAHEVNRRAYYGMDGPRPCLRED
mmetsp:Transcript_15522/g.38804  ORF Transcript_15522/g.38804 Transcript_15522/m.38804 type:complete len:367 (-) Transcript_15522:143-1243(-)|eukprot:jgi/Tetstr1/464298/TSEL_009100.t1